MKKLFFSLIFMFSVTFVKAQLNIFAGAGINISNLKVSGFEGYYTSSTLNYYLSARPTLKLSDNLHISVDLQFSKRGFTTQDSTGIPPGRYQFLEIIPQVEYKIGKGLGIYGGISVGINGGEEYKINDVWEKAKVKVLKKSDLGIVLGLRFYPNNRISISTQISNSLVSVSDIIYTDNNGNKLDTKFIFRNIQIGVAYRFI
ncbi:MAG: outer membrane beta-barrel protein [Saprospiraceae bacterium]|nr:outer membrane beta-barrel protein [Saprospiraceae bacterium]